MLVRRAAIAAVVVMCCGISFGQVASQNINMVSGTNWPAGDPYLQRQNEPSMAVSSRNPEHLLAGSNDYRTVDIPRTLAPNILGDAWVSIFTSMDGGETWKSTLLPGYPQDTSSIGTSSPLHSFTVATDPTVRAGTHGMFYYSGLAFNRGANSPSGVFVAMLQDQNNKGNGDAAYLSTTGGKTHGNPFAYLGVSMVDTGTSGQFLDKPWIVVDIPRPGRSATCTVNGNTFTSGYVYVVYTQFNGSQNNPSSKIKEVESTNCGATWTHPQVLSQAQKLAQGTVAAIDPTTGNVYVAWRQIGIPGNQNQPDAIQWAVSTNGGSSFTAQPALYTFTAPTTANPYPPGSVFDQPQATETTFRTLDVPAMAVDGTGRVWVAFSKRFNGPTAGTYSSRIMITTLPAGATMGWTTPYVADGSAASTTTTRTYGHQFMPSLNFAYGKLMLAWFDSRRDNLESILHCSNAPCSDLSQVTAVDVPLPGTAGTADGAGGFGTTITNPAAIFTPYMSDPNTGVRHTIDVFGSVINPSAGNPIFPGFQISQYSYYVDDANGQLEQAFFNPPNLPMFVDGTTPFIGDYIDIASQNILPSGNSWVFNTQASDGTGATNAPDFHVTWTDNRDVVPPPVVAGSQDWTQYVPPNGGNSQTSTYSGTGSACPTCTTVQPACSLVAVTNADGTPGTSSYSGDRNQNIYTSRVSSGLVVRFAENTKPQPANTPPPPQRSYSLLVKNTVSPLSTTPTLGLPSYYRILLGVTSTNQVPSCGPLGVSFPGMPACTLDAAVNPRSTLTQVVTINSSIAGANVNVLVAQLACPADYSFTVSSPGAVMCTNSSNHSIAASYAGLQAVAVINGDPTNPSVADPDFLTTDNDNPDAAAPYATLPIAAGEEYDPTVDGPPDPTNDIFTPKISVPAVFTPKIGTEANSAPTIETPTIFTPKITSIFTPKITSVQVANPTIVDTIFTPKIFTPKIFTPKIVSPDIFTPKISNLSDNSLTDYSWRVTNKGNTSASYKTSEFAKAAGVSCCPASCSATPTSCTVTDSNPAGPSCSVCQLVQHKVYESPVANRDSSNINPTCDLTVQQQYITVANVPDPAFTTGSGGTGSVSDPTSSTLSLGPGQGNRVTLRVVAPPVTQTVSSFKTTASSLSPDQINGQSIPAGSLTISTTTLPVAVVGQTYSASFSSFGGFGAAAWSVPADPGNPVAAQLPISPEPIGVSTGLSSNYLLNQAGQISADTVSDAPGSYYPLSAQVQDSAPTASLDVQQVELDVNQFRIASVDIQPSPAENELGSAVYMQTGDTVTVAVTVTNQGPVNATSVIPNLTPHPTAGGTPSGPAPAISCGAPDHTNDTIAAGSTAIPDVFKFVCTAGSGNGFVTFTANATGHYVNSAADVTATAVALTAPPTTDMLVGNVAIDNTSPTLAFGPTSSTQSAPGWYNTPVVVPYTTGDNLSGVAFSTATSPATSTGTTSGNMTLTSEGKLVTGSMTATDYSRNTSAMVTSAAFQIDRTLPTISGAPDRAANANAWYNALVTVTFTCLDPNPSNGPAGQQSGVASCTSPINLSTEGTNLSALGAVSDKAANSANTTVTGINIDTTAPTISGSPDRAPNVNGWYNAPVTVSFLCADPSPLNPVGPGAQQSGIATCSAPVMLSSDGAAQSVPGTAFDKAGNQTAVVVGGINIDRTPPAIAVNSTYTPNVWTNQSVVVTFTCSDNLSGPAANNPVITGNPSTGWTVSYTQSNLTSVATVTVSGNTPVSGTTLNASCQDLAGNNAQPASFGPILIDTTPPTITATANLNSDTGPSYTANTWTNQSVVVTFACSDSLSGVKPGSITGSNTYGSQGSYNANGSCQDNAGNTANAQFGPVLIDTTTPGVLITSPVAQTYVLNQQITPSFTCGDNSGGDATTCTATPSASPYTANTVGPATFSVQGVDQAGNTTNPSVSYLVVYNFTGFQAPLQPAVMMNPPSPQSPPQPGDSGSFTIGTAIPIAWQLQDANNVYIADLTTLTSIVAVPNPSCAGTVSGSGTTLYNATTGQTAFSYDATHQRFVFNWDTAGMTAGCYNLVVKTNDSAQWATIVHLSTENFLGFDAPLTVASAPANPSNSGTLEIRSTIPVSWEMFIPNAGYDSAQQVTLSNVSVYANAGCSGAVPSGTPYAVLSNGSGGSYTFLAARGVYTVNWDTTGTPAGCYDIVVTMSDQSVYTTMVTLANPGATTTLLSFNFENASPGATTAPASYVAPNIAGPAFSYSRSNINGVSDIGCVIADCFNVSGVTAGDYYSFTLVNNTAISDAALSFWEFNNDCQNLSPCPPNGPSFVVQYDTDPAFSNPAPTQIGNYQPAEPGSANLSFPIGALPAGTYYFRITVVGNDADGTGQYVFDNVSITGSH